MSEHPAPGTDAGLPRSRASAVLRRRRRAAIAGALVLILVTGVGLIISRVDSDGDGLTDVAEKWGWRTAAGATYVTDPTKSDTDGDGLTDADEAGRVVEGWGPSAVYTGHSDPTRPDSDGDGLDDKLETRGWLTTREVAYLTDPWNPDTDGDSLTDGEEAGIRMLEADERVEFDVFSDPLVADTDGDSLTDAQEADLSIDPFNADTDGDQLSDVREVVALGTAPDLADTDGDGWDDAYEVENRDSRGLDPLWPDEQIDPAVYAWDFARGAFIGELAPGDSPAWLAGNLASGGASFIPGVGGVLGGVADLRDAVGSAIRADWIGAGFSVVGLVPAVGDAAAIPAKTANFVVRHPELAPVVGAAIVALDWVPRPVKVATVERITTNWEYLRSAGSSESSLLRLQQGRVGLDSVAEAMKRPGHVMMEGVKPRFFGSGADGEAFLAKMYPSGTQGAQTQVVRSTKDCTEMCNAVARRFDVVADNVAHESKVGRVYLSPSIERQIRSDAYLMDMGDIETAHWHFFASAGSNTIGPSKQVLDLLEEVGIPYTIHLPA